MMHVAIFLSIFGPKIGGFDTRILLMFIVLLNYKYIRLANLHNFSKFLLTILFCYSIVSYSIILNDNYDIMLRYGRALFTFLIVPLLIEVFARKNGINSIINGVRNILLLHAIVMLIMFIFPTVSPIIWKIWSYEKGFYSLRVSGLTAGYDIAGFFTNIGFMISIFLLIKNKGIINIMSLFLFALVTLLSSRGNLVYFIVELFLLFWILIKNFQKINAVTKFVLFITLITGAMIIQIFILPILFSSIVNLQHFINNSFIYEYVDSYSQTDAVQMISSFYILPETFSGMIFGLNSDINSDSGYIKIIYFSGLIGLFLILLFYLTNFIACYKNFKKFREYDRTTNSNYMSDLFQLFIYIIGFTFVVNVKNLFFLTRGAFDLFVIIFTVVLIYNKNMFIFSAKEEI